MSKSIETQKSLGNPRKSSNEKVQRGDLSGQMTKTSVKSTADADISRDLISNDDHSIFLRSKKERHVEAPQSPSARSNKLKVSPNSTNKYKSPDRRQVDNVALAGQQATTAPRMIRGSVIKSPSSTSDDELASGRIEVIQRRSILFKSSSRLFAASGVSPKSRVSACLKDLISSDDGDDHSVNSEVSVDLYGNDGGMYSTNHTPEVSSPCNELESLPVATALEFVICVAGKDDPLTQNNVCVHEAISPTNSIATAQSVSPTDSVDALAQVAFDSAEVLDDSVFMEECASTFSGDTSNDTTSDDVMAFTSQVDGFDGDQPCNVFQSSNGGAFAAYHTRIDTPINGVLRYPSTNRSSVTSTTTTNYNVSCSAPATHTSSQLHDNIGTARLSGVNALYDEHALRVHVDGLKQKDQRLFKKALKEAKHAVIEEKERVLDALGISKSGKGIIEKPINKSVESTLTRTADLVFENDEVDLVNKSKSITVPLPSISNVFNLMGINHSIATTTAICSTSIASGLITSSDVNSVSVPSNIGAFSAWGEYTRQNGRGAV